jgi:hypothetical protein
MKTDAATLKRVYAMSLAGVSPHYVAKAEKKGRTKAEVDEIIRWLTGYTQKQLESILEKRTNIETFISKARMNPSRTLVTGSICGVRVEEIEDPVMQGVRYLDKLIDELAKGRPMEKIRSAPSPSAERRASREGQTVGGLSRRRQREISRGAITSHERPAAMSTPPAPRFTVNRPHDRDCRS